VAGDPSDPSASAPPFPPSAASTAPIPADVADFARRALRHRLSLDEALTLADDHGFRHAAFGSGGETNTEAVAGRGRIGALAAVGAPQRSTTGPSSASPTASSIAAVRPRRRYRERLRGRRPGIPDRLGHRRPRDGRGGLRPQRPGPILHGIRGDDANACREIAEEIASEPVERTATFLTNQGTDAHLAPGAIGDLRDGAGYRVAGVVASEPETKRGDTSTSTWLRPTMIAFRASGVSRSNRPVGSATACALSVPATG